MVYKRASVKGLQNARNNKIIQNRPQFMYTAFLSVLLYANIAIIYANSTVQHTHGRLHTHTHTPAGQPETSQTWIGGEGKQWGHCFCCRWSTRVMNMPNAKRYTGDIRLAERSPSVKLNPCLHIDVSTDKCAVQFKSSTRCFSIKESGIHVRLHIKGHMSRSFKLVVFFFKYCNDFVLYVVPSVYSNFDQYCTIQGSKMHPLCTEYMYCAFTDYKLPRILLG